MILPSLFRQDDKEKGGWSAAGARCSRYRRFTRRASQRETVGCRKRAQNRALGREGRKGSVVRESTKVRRMAFARRNADLPANCGPGGLQALRMRRSATDGKIIFTGTTTIKRRIFIRPIVPARANRPRRYSL